MKSGLIRSNLLISFSTMSFSLLADRIRSILEIVGLKILKSKKWPSIRLKAEVGLH